jgi:tripartite-type tricarboxylate transporter receptor subunit TctC
MERALREPPDGYTFLFISGSYTANLALSKQRRDPLALIQPVIQSGWQPTVLVTNQKFKSLPDLIEAAKNAPSTLNYGTSGVGSLNHFGVEDLARVAGIKLVHIPYKGSGQAIPDLASGQLDLMSAGVTSAIAMAKTGKIRIVAITNPARLPDMPGIPTTLELGVPYVGGLWHGLVASKGVQADIVKKMNEDIAVALKDAETVTAFKTLMVTPVGGTPEQFGAVIAKEYERVRSIAEAANIQSQQ